MVHTLIFDVGGTLMGAAGLCDEITALFSTAEGSCLGAESLGNNDQDTDLEAMVAATFSRYYGQATRLAADFEPMSRVLENTLSSLSAQLGVEDKSGAAVELYHHLYLKKSWLFEDTHSTLEHFRQQGVNMLIASDADSELLHKEFEQYALKPYFQQYFISEDLRAYKPTDEFVAPMRELVEKAKLEGDVFFIGDSVVDILAGKKLGVKTVFKTVPGVKPALGADYYIENLSELITICKND